ncbi:hypothetical protein Y032_0419g1124 [Ancylostoma ceylanicum]|uniref:Uncharacterized protein n=1 Tax=Ancylostoma ceylanicum TaxID=53326 RepID=A0A016X2E5_9BILA|nr:hypothetical protein Y032_0419g1124 [Ancylostoma ceylanicum]
MSFAGIMLLLVMKHEKSEKITKLGRKASRNSTPTADDYDSGSCGAVAWRLCRGCGWVTAIDALFIFSMKSLEDTVPTVILLF